MSEEWISTGLAPNDGAGDTLRDGAIKINDLLYPSLISRVVSTPPVEPSEGDKYLVPTGATGLWSGWDGKLTAFRDGAWRFYTINNGFFCWDLNDDKLLIWRSGGPEDALVPGSQGIQGDTGPQGIQGVQGLQGNIGLQGDQGIQGDTGSQGIQGDTGPQGIQGDTGPQGVQGDTGSQGPVAGVYNESAQMAITLNSRHTWTHGLGSQPKIFGAYIVCQTAEDNYAVGEKVNLMGFGTQYYGATAHGVNDTDIFGIVNYGLKGVSGTGAAITLTPANWKIVMWGIWF